MDQKHNTKTSRSSYSIVMFQGGPPHKPFFIAIDNQEQVIIGSSKKTVAIYIVGELKVLVWFMRTWILKREYCYNCCFLDIAWTRVKGNDNMIGCAIIVSVSISCSRCNNLARSSCFITHSPHVQQAYSSWTTSIYSINTLLYSYTLPIDSSPTSSLNLCLSCNLSQV